MREQNRRLMQNGQESKRWIGWLVVVLIASGIFLRVHRYWQGFSFWGDEAWVALDIVVRPYWAIMSNALRYPNLPAPPVGFLLTEKTLVTWFGYQEMVFRFFPCLCGVGAVFLFRKLLARLVRDRVVWMALAFFVFSNALVYYSAELKQYSSDVLFGVLFLLAHFRSVRRAMDKPRLLQLAVVGIVGLLFSLPIILLVCGVASAQIGIYVYRRDFAVLKRYLLIVGLWLFWFWGLWNCFYHANYVGPTVISYQKPYYLSLPPLGGDWIGWGRKLYAVFENPVGLSWPWLAVLMFLVGGWSFWRGKKEFFLPLVAPVALTVVLSMGDKYPFHGRYLLFLLPVFFVLIAEGIGRLMDIPRWGRLAGGMVFFLLLMQPLMQAGSPPSGTCDLRSMVTYLRTHERAGDRIYLNNETLFGYLFYYYPQIPQLQGMGKIVEWLDDGPDGQFMAYYSYSQNEVSRVYDWDHVVSPSGEITRLPGGGRTWVLLSEMPPDTERFLLHCLDGFGTRRDAVRGHNAALYLYDLN